MLDPAEEFWEANFLHALMCLAADTARPFQRAQRVVAESRLPYGDDSGPGFSWLERADPGPGPEDVALVREALGLLDEPERTAVYLHILEDWPVVDSRGGPSVSRHLGVSDRTVRNYLTRGLSKLRAHYAGQEAPR
jgi:DNA-directed RNA polymerase specialized sigma24 family protein